MTPPFRTIRRGGDVTAIHDRALGNSCLEVLARSTLGSSQARGDNDGLNIKDHDKPTTPDDALANPHDKRLDKHSPPDPVDNVGPNIKSVDKPKDLANRGGSVGPNITPEDFPDGNDGPNIKRHDAKPNMPRSGNAGKVEQLDASAAHQLVTDILAMRAPVHVPKLPPSTGARPGEALPTARRREPPEGGLSQLWRRRWSEQQGV